MRKLGISICLMFWSSLAVAADFPKSISPFVNDFAQIIDPQTENRITQTLQQLRAEKGVELTVVTIERITDYNASGGVPKFTIDLFNHWGVGDKTLNNGILFLVARGDREMFIGLGKGYPTEYDKRMDTVFEHHVKGYFVNNQYAQGIEAGVIETIKRTEAGWISSRPQHTAAQTILRYFIPILFGIGALFLILRHKIADTVTSMKRCPVCDNRKLTVDRRTRHATRDVMGQQTIVTNCQNCDYHNERVRVLPIRTSSSNSGGSFGGGSSSGGGGGGKW